MSKPNIGEGEIFDSVSDWISIIDLDYIIQYTNKTGEEMFSLSKDQIINKTCCKLIHNSDVSLEDCPLKKMLKTKKREKTDIFSHERNRWYEITVDPIFNKNNKITGAVHIVRDITERKKIEEELKLSKENYKTIFNSSTDSIFIHDFKTGEIVDVNDTVVKRFGYSKDKFKELNVGDLSINKPPYTQKEAVEWIKKAAKESPQRFEWLAKSKNGSLFWYENTLKLVNISGKKRVLVIGRDITDRKKAQEEIRESEKKYRDLVENIQEGLWQIDKDGHTIFVNKKMADMFGYKINEMIGKHLFDFMSKEWIKVAEDKLKKRKKGRIENHEFEFIKKNGDILYCFLSTTPFKKNNEYHGALASVIDISDKKKAEEKLKKSEIEHKTLLENIPDWVWKVDKNGVYTYSSPQVKNLMGYKINEIIGKTPFDFMDRDEAKRIGTIFKKIASKQEKITNLIDKMQTKNGKEIIFETNGTPQFDNKGNLIGYSGTCRDITERKRREQELKKGLMKYNLKDGCLYLELEKTHAKSMTAFKDLIKTGYKGTIISRTPKKQFKEDIKNITTYKWITEKNIKNSIQPTIINITKEIEKETEKQAIYIDRLDYIISKIGFKKTLDLIQKITEIAYMKNHVIILSLDQDILNKKQTTKIKKETNEIESKLKIPLDEDLKDIIEYVYQKNLNGVKPSYTEIGEELKISKPTTRNKIRRLVKKGLLNEKTKGRKKTLEITDKTRNILT